MKMQDILELNFSIMQRLRMIDVLLDRYGYVDRSVIAEYFGISAVQASVDLRMYSQVAPGNARYDPARKSHARLDTFKRRFA